MEMTIKKEEGFQDRYEIKCRFLGDKIRKIKSDCKLEVKEESLAWNIKYSSKFFCFYQTRQERLSKHLIKDISIKKVYAKKYGITYAMIAFFLLYFAADIYIMLLAEGDIQWMLRSVAAFFGGILLSVMWILVSRISVLQVTTVDHKKYRIPFSTKRLDDEYEEAVKKELLRKLSDWGLRVK